MNETRKYNLLNNFHQHISFLKDSFLVNLINDQELCLFIIKNNLYWRNINSIFECLGYDNTNNMLKILKANDTYNKLFSISEDDFYNIVNSCDYLFVLKELLKRNNNLFRSYCNYINNNPNKLILEIITSGFQKEEEDIKLDLTKGKIFDMVKLMLIGLLKAENKTYSDIQLLSEGEYSKAYSIGDKIFKIGIPRETFTMMNNKRFLKPLYRSNIIGINEILGCIEITEKVDTKGITKEDAKLIYNELRDNGYIWCDCRIDNLGRLIKPNKTYYKNIEPSLNAINYLNENDEVLDSGELVIIDNDYIYTYEEFSNLPYNERELLMYNVWEYEENYQKLLRESSKVK